MTFVCILYSLNCLKLSVPDSTDIKPLSVNSKNHAGFRYRTFLLVAKIIWPIDRAMYCLIVEKIFYLHFDCSNLAFVYKKSVQIHSSVKFNEF